MATAKEKLEQCQVIYKNLKMNINTSEDAMVAYALNQFMRKLSAESGETN